MSADSLRANTGLTAQEYSRPILGLIFLKFAEFHFTQAKGSSRRGNGLERFNSGASVLTLNRNDIHGNPVIAPPTCLIEKFESIASVNHKQIHLLKRKSENLKQQRDMLLPKLISGQIELKD